MLSVAALVNQQVNSTCQGKNVYSTSLLAAKAQMCVILEKGDELFFSCCYKKLPQTWWLKIAQLIIFNSSVGQKSNTYLMRLKIRQDYFHFWRLYGSNLCSYLFQLLGVIYIP